MKISVRSCKVNSSDRGNKCGRRDKEVRQDVKGSVVPIDELMDDEDTSNDVSSDDVRDVIFEVADMIGTADVLDSIVRWFSSWDLVPFANDLLDNHDLKYVEE